MIRDIPKSALILGIAGLLPFMFGAVVLPALWAFFMVGGGPVSAGMNLIAGFVALLVLDFAFWTWGLAPRWWMALRVMLTAIVILCLIPVIL